MSRSGTLARGLALALTLWLLPLGTPSMGCGASAPRATEPAPAPSIPWREASDAAFAEAAREGRLVLLSLQADWCHWCHVMNDTTYRDPSVAALIARRFVAVRAEADARPDLAERYGAWGWPATIVLTADGREIVALRGFRDAGALRAILERADLDPSPIDIFATSGARERGAESAPLEGATLEGAAAAAERQLDAMYDEAEEGWGTPQKYPFAAPVLHALGRRAPWPERAERTLERYTRLVDPVWGGMYQYSERGDWEHPHFERIAVVQAGALEALAELHRRSRDGAWLEPAWAIVRFVRDFLRTSEGGFRASMDADLRRTGQAPVHGADYFALDDTERRALGLPRVDPHVYASSNGALAAALARLASSLERSDPRRSEALALAEAAVAFSLARHRDPASGLFRHDEHDEDASGRRYLADQVAMLRALLALQHAQGDAARSRVARSLADAIESAFCDLDHGCRSVSSVATREDGALALHAPRIPLEENGRLAQALAAVADLASERGYEERAQRYLEAAATPEAVRAAGRIVGDFLLGAAMVTSERAVAHVVGPPGDPRTLALFDAAQQAAELRTRVELAAPGEGRYPYPGEPSLFVCSLDACAAPLTDPALVSARLREFARGGASARPRSDIVAP